MRRLLGIPRRQVRAGRVPGRGHGPRCLEEIGLRVVVGPLRRRSTYRYPHGLVELSFHDCTDEDPDAEPDPGSGFRWVAAADLPGYTFPGANEPVVAGLAAEWSAPARTRPLTRNPRRDWPDLAEVCMSLPMLVALTVGPLACYFYVVGVWQSGRHPRLVAGPVDFAVLAFGVSGLLTVGPVGPAPDAADLRHPRACGLGALVPLPARLWAAVFAGWASRRTSSITSTRRG